MTARLFVQMLYLTVEIVFCTLVDVNLITRNCFIYRLPWMHPARLLVLHSSRSAFCISPVPTVPRRTVPFPHTCIGSCPNISVQVPAQVVSSLPKPHRLFRL